MFPAVYSKSNTDRINVDITMDCNQILTHLIFTFIVIEIVWYASISVFSDPILSFPNLNTYNGPTLSYVEHGRVLGAKYDDISCWNGYRFEATMDISHIRLAASNILVLETFEQSSDSVVIDDKYKQCIWGLPIIH
ncbi:hypothetical protein RTP6_004154 [Batrachochytrium dendrobatidis]